MTKLLWKSLLAAPAAIGAALAISGAAVAAETAPVESTAASVDALEQIDFSQEPVQLAQVTSVQQLTDVLPSDWAFQALQNLVNNYQCIQGYPDRTFRGNRSMTRYEFAAGLNACLDVVAGLIGTGGLTGEDLATIQRLQEEFQAELATLRGRVDALEARTAELEANQFSTTTKLRGQVDFHLGGPFDEFDGIDAATANVVLNNNIALLEGAGIPVPGLAGPSAQIGSTGAFADGLSSEDSISYAARARLNFDTSFTGEDRLRVRLQAGDGNALVPFGGYANASGDNFNLTVDDFYYQFPIGERIDIIAAANSVKTDDFVTSTIVPFDGPSVADAGGPLFYDAGMAGDAGLGVSFAFTDNLVLDAGYSVDNNSGSNPDIGLFGAGQSYIVQLSYLSDGFMDLGAAYLHSDGAADFRNGYAGGVDTFAGMVNLKFGGFEVGGYGAYTDFNGGDDFNWLVGVAFNDLFIEGSQLGIYGGQLPDISQGAVLLTDGINVTKVEATTDNPFLIEGYYEIPFNEFLTITPSIVYADANFDPNLSSDSTTLYGVVRATFRF